MGKVLHIIDTDTPQDMLWQLAALADADRVLCVGPRPPIFPLGLTIDPVHMPMGSTTLGGLRLVPLARGAEIFHCWSCGALEAAQSMNDYVEGRLILSLPAAPPPDKFPSLLKDILKGRLTVTLPTDASRRAMVELGRQQTSDLFYEKQRLGIDDGQDLAADVLAIEGGIVQLTPQIAPIADLPARRQATRKRLGLSDGQRLIVAPGEMLPQAGHKYVMWAHAILRQMVDQVYLALPDSGPAVARVEFFSNTTGCGSEIFLPRQAPLVSGIDRRDCLAAADLAVFLPEADCGVVAVAEAMLAGLPIVAARTRDIQECTGGGSTANSPPGGEAALLVPAIPREAAAAMLKIVDNPKLARRLGEAASSRARAIFDPIASKAQLHAIYQEPARMTNSE
jgi:glycosyltransferase involved in cell wall biosynthesis